MPLHGLDSELMNEKRIYIYRYVTAWRDRTEAKINLPCGDHVIYTSSIAAQVLQALALAFV